VVEGLEAMVPKARMLRGPLAAFRDLVPTANRRHEARVLRVGPWVRGRLLLFDLGFFRYQLFACITRNGGYFLARLKRYVNPRIVVVYRRHRGCALALVGERLQDVLARLDSEVLDLDVEVKVTFPRRRYGGRVHRDHQRLRVVGLKDEASGEDHPIEMRRHAYRPRTA